MKLIFCLTDFLSCEMLSSAPGGLYLIILNQRNEGFLDPLLQPLQRCWWSGDVHIDIVTSWSSCNVLFFNEYFNALLNHPDSWHKTRFRLINYLNKWQNRNYCLKKMYKFYLVHFLGNQIQNRFHNKAEFTNQMNEAGTSWSISYVLIQIIIKHTQQQLFSYPASITKNIVSNGREVLSGGLYHRGSGVMVGGNIQGWSNVLLPNKVRSRLPLQWERCAWVLVALSLFERWKLGVATVDHLQCYSSTAPLPTCKQNTGRYPGKFGVSTYTD